MDSGPEYVREFSGNFREFQGIPTRVPGKFQGNFRECLGFQGIPGKFQGISEKISGTFREFQRIFQGISGNSRILEPFQAPQVPGIGVCGAGREPGTKLEGTIDALEVGERALPP